MRIRSAPGVVAGLALALAAGLGLPPTAQAALDDPREDHRDERASTPAARQALADARAATGRDATLALRDLALRGDELGGADLAAARALLARPTDPANDNYYGDGVEEQISCGEQVCVHWVEEGPEASEPEFAAQVLTTMEEIHTRFVAAGYRGPLPDDGLGGTDQPDIYLADIGENGLYGYCSPDVDESGLPEFVDGETFWAYCGLDNNYSPEEYGDRNTPLDLMRVTAAHEYFHAVQFGYNGLDDRWLLESTATWVEDEMYDDINDSWDYLAASQLAQPWAPLDMFGESRQYGNWIFWRYLTEKYGDETGELPSLVLEVWNALDSTAAGGSSELYSLQAVRQVLAARGLDLADEYAMFALENLTPELTYEEASDPATPYPHPGLEHRPVKLTREKDRATRRVVLDHLTSGTVRFKPGVRHRRLKVHVDMTARNRGSRAAVTAFGRHGIVSQGMVLLGRGGNGTVRVPFGPRRVRYVDVTLINTSSEMIDCSPVPLAGSPYACGGFGRHDGQEHSITVRAVKPR